MYMMIYNYHICIINYITMSIENIHLMMLMYTRVYMRGRASLSLPPSLPLSLCACACARLHVREVRARGASYY